MKNKESNTKVNTSGRRVDEGEGSCWLELAVLTEKLSSVQCLASYLICIFSFKKS